MKPPESDVPSEVLIRNKGSSHFNLEESHLKSLQGTVFAMMRLHTISNDIIGTLWNAMLESSDENRFLFKAADFNQINQALVTISILEFEDAFSHVKTSGFFHSIKKRICLESIFLFGGIKSFSGVCLLQFEGTVWSRSNESSSHQTQRGFFQ